MTNKLKSQVQEEALRAWIDNNYLGTVCLFTGCGKTKVGVDAIKQYYYAYNELPKVLIVVPSINLKKNEWPNEIKKWGNENMLDLVRIEVINTACRIEDKDFDLIIVDEVHISLSEEFGKVHDIKCKAKLGLTATPPTHNPEYMERLSEVCPVIYQKTLQEGVEMEIASPFNMYNLSTTFTRSERNSYNLWNHKFEKAKKQIWMYIKHVNKLGYPTPSDNVFDCASEWVKKEDHPMHKEAKEFWNGMTRRKWVCYKAVKKIDAIVDIIQKYPDKKWIIFSKSTEFVDTTYEVLLKFSKASRYHSKMDNKERAQHLQDFKDGKTNILVSADALNQGFDLPEIDAAICASGTSVTLTLVQQLGRIVRIKDEKQALFINLYVENTQEKKWVETKTNGFNPHYVTKIDEI